MTTPAVHLLSIRNGLYDLDTLSYEQLKEYMQQLEAIGDRLRGLYDEATGSAKGTSPVNKEKTVPGVFFVRAGKAPEEPHYHVIRCDTGNDAMIIAAILDGMIIGCDTKPSHDFVKKHCTVLHRVLPQPDLPRQKK